VARTTRNGAGFEAAVLDRLLQINRFVHSHSRPSFSRPPLISSTLAALAALAAFAGPAAAQDGGGSRRRHHGRQPTTTEAPPTGDAASTAPPRDEGSAHVAAPQNEAGAQAAAPDDGLGGAEVAASNDGSSVEPAAGAAGESRILRLGVVAGLGRVHEREAGDAANFSGVGLRVAYIGVEDLTVALDSSLQLYERSYVTNLPGNPGAASLRVPVDELRMRTGLQGGYNVLGAAGVDRDLAGASPFLRLELDQFSNDVVPQTVFGLGLGLDAFVRVANGLRLEGNVAYSYAASAGNVEVVSRLAFGKVLGALRYGGGISISLLPRARLRLSYAGEWLALEHSSRYENSLSLGLDVDL
jgi:hypothetical protein